MPRDGSTIYHKPFPDVVHDTTIESAIYNGFVNDIEGDLNNPRPILSGGTGQNNARDAMIALKGEIALQFVENYDSNPWVNGSFYSNAGASGAPNSTSAFVGIYYEHLNTDYATIEARDITGTPYGNLWIRQKAAGVWGSWLNETVTLNNKVNRNGDAMTGGLSATSFTSPDSSVNKLGDVHASRGVNAGVVFFGTSDERYIMHDGARYAFSGAYPVASDAAPTELNHFVRLTELNTKLGLGGGTMSGAITFTAPSHWNWSPPGAGSYYATPAGADRFFVGTDAPDIFRILAVGAGNVMTVDAVTGQVIFTGSPQVATPPVSDNDTSIANTAFVTRDFLAKAGGTMTGAIVTAPADNLALAGPAPSIQVFGGASHSAMAFHCPGSFGTNFGLANDGNFWMGGWSHGANLFRFWTTRDFAALPSNFVTGNRLVYITDLFHSLASGMAENWPGAVVTGATGLFSNGITLRYRYLQYLISGVWYTAGTA